MKQIMDYNKRKEDEAKKKEATEKGTAPVTPTIESILNKKEKFDKERVLEIIEREYPNEKSTDYLFTMLRSLYYLQKEKGYEERAANLIPKIDGRLREVDENYNRLIKLGFNPKEILERNLKIKSETRKDASVPEDNDELMKQIMDYNKRKEEAKKQSPEEKSPKSKD
jgi:hypothetical protein